MIISGQQLKRAVVALRADMKARVKNVQGGVPTFFDNFLGEMIGRVLAREANHCWDPSLPAPGGASGEPTVEDRGQLRWLEQLIARREQGRYIDFCNRETASRGKKISDIGDLEMLLSQGAESCLSWKGQPLFKTVFDFALVPMLMWEVRPATIFEIGSGTGASAIWMMDLLRSFGRTASIYSVDLCPVSARYEGVAFLSGDCAKPESLFSQALLRSAPHPWLVIEDAHVNVVGVLTHIDPFMTPGDYLFVEDSRSKVRALADFLAERSNRFKVDCRYTDYFGRNATCAPDSIFIRV